MSFIKPKKSLGQHFLKDANIARKITGSLQCKEGAVIEIGPGEGILTRLILEKQEWEAYFVETDREAVEYLRNNFPEISGRLINEDFLKLDITDFIKGRFCLIGNLPYNISSQVFFKVLKHRNEIVQAVFMVQKEVAERIASGPGNKKYGILSVLLQAFFNIEYLFTVSENVFFPPPKVKSAVIRLTRNETHRLDCDENEFFNIVKAGFNQRRKTLRNSLKMLNYDLSKVNTMYLGMRPEQLDVKDFIAITKTIIR